MKNIAIFNNLQDSFAMLLWSIIISDEIVSKKEKKEFNAFFKKEFALKQHEIDALFEKVAGNQESLEKHLNLLKLAFRSHPGQKIRFMRYLNSCIICDGVDKREYVTFEEIRQKLF